MPGRRVCLYFSWSRPQEIDVDLGILDNRYPALFEFRRAVWPTYKRASELGGYEQNVGGFLDHVIHYDFLTFEGVIAAETGHPLSVIERVGEKPPMMEIDDDMLSHVDTLIVVSLDHYRTKQKPSSGEVEAIKSFLARENSCLIVCPHHDVGGIEDLPAREMQHLHHGDPLVPSQQRIGGFAKSLLDELGFPIENRFGLNPGRAADGSPGMLVRAEGDREPSRLLDGVLTFNLHPHLPHFWIPPGILDKVEVLAKQPINLNASPHPFMEEGNNLFNAFLHIPPGGERSGHIFVCDATLWSAAFGGKSSLQRLWINVARF